MRQRRKAVLVADYIASVSGGKDSAAMCLYLKEQEIDHHRVFFDTGWEHPELYRYLKNELPKAIGPIEWVTAPLPKLDQEREALAINYEERLGHKSAMVRWMLYKAMFPSRMRRWCTETLKIKALKAYMRSKEFDLPVNTVGVRAAESKYRSTLPERELSTSLDCMVWRPLLRWSTQDVIDIHTRHQLKPCSLYLKGADRVGCWPCIFSRKSEVRYLAETDHHRVDLIRDLEADLTRLCGSKRAMLRKGDDLVGIDETVRWSKTSRGGKQFSMFRQDEIEPGCMSWGLCDTGNDLG
tara:strand:- start:170 stop:1057 length:888 start_codon:yes stop_codon:yes gene_type:complete